MRIFYSGTMGAVRQNPEFLVPVADLRVMMTFVLLMGRCPLNEKIGYIKVVEQRFRRI